MLQIELFFTNKVNQKYFQCIFKSMKDLQINIPAKDYGPTGSTSPKFIEL